MVSVALRVWQAHKAKGQEKSHLTLQVYRKVVFLHCRSEREYLSGKIDNECSPVD